MLKELCTLEGVSGDEDRVRDWIAQRARPCADQVRTDALGNLIVWKKGKKSTGNKLMLCAHMDEVGLIVTRVTEEGFLKFDFVGGVDRRVAIGKPVVLGPDRIPGVIGLKAIHLVSREERQKAPKTDALYVDIGAEQKALSGGGGSGAGGGDSGRRTGGRQPGGRAALAAPVLPGGVYMAARRRGSGGGA